MTLPARRLLQSSGCWESGVFFFLVFFLRLLFFLREDCGGSGWIEIVTFMASRLLLKLLFVRAAALWEFLLEKNSTLARS